MEEKVDRDGNFSSCEDALGKKKGLVAKGKKFILPGNSCEGFVPDFFWNIPIGLRHAFAEIERPCQHFQEFSSVHAQGWFEENALGRISLYDTFRFSREDERCVPFSFRYVMEAAVIEDMGDLDAASEDEHFCEFRSAHQFPSSECPVGVPLDNAVREEEVHSTSFWGMPFDIGDGEERFDEGG